jgi:hypothetical protein
MNHRSRSLSLRWAVLVAAIGFALLTACEPASGVRRCDNVTLCSEGEVCTQGYCARAPQENDSGSGGGTAEVDASVPGGGSDSGTPVVVEIDAGPPQACTPGQLCRAAAGECDVAEFCGLDGVCPGNKVKGPGTECRAAAAACDTAEVCSGASAECPSDSFKAAGTQCRAAEASAACDVAEACTGASAACPADDVAAATVVCRQKNGPCDAEERCTGNSKTCPGDSFVPASAKLSCRPKSANPSDVCDVEDFCDGTSATCADSFVPANATTACRPSAGDCDIAEKCTGLSAQCPADVLRSGADVCRAVVAGNDCDLEERCSGVSAQCPVDKVKLTNTPCRESLGSCDLEDRCDGTSKVCQDARKPSTEVCRSSKGICDIAEFCAGGVSCPADGFSTLKCAEESACVLASFCPGNGPNCPAQALVPQGTACGAGRVDECNDQDTCDNAGNCLENVLPDGTGCSGGCGPIGCPFGFSCASTCSGGQCNRLGCVEN